MSLFGQLQGGIRLRAIDTASWVGVQGLARLLTASSVTHLVNVLVITVAISLLMANALKRYEHRLEDAVLTDHLIQTDSRDVASGKGDVAGAASLQGLAAYAAIAKRDLFATVKQKAVDKPEQEDVKIEQMPLASLKLQLMGTVSSADSAMRTAIIADANGRNEKIYREGDQVRTARIRKILRYAVVLNSGGKDEVLRMEMGANSQPVKSARASLSRKPQAQMVTLDSRMVKKALRNIPALLQSARFQRYRSGGINGFRLRTMLRDSAFARLGLRSNDIVLGVNGEPLTHMNQADSLYRQLEQGEDIRLNIQRNGRQQDIFVRLR